MKNILICILQLLFILPATQANSEAMCQDLAKYACSNNTYDDGTGIVEPESIENNLKKAQKTFTAISNEMNNLVKKISGSQAEKDYLAAFGLDQDDCFVNEKRSDQCTKALVKSLTEVTYKIYDLTLNNKKINIDLQNKNSFSDILYIIEEKNFSESLKKIDENLIKPDNSKKLEQVKKNYLPKAKKILIEQVKKLPINTEQNKEKLIAKINAVEYSTAPCLSDELAEQQFVNAMYIPAKRDVSLCAGLLNNSSVFSIVYILAHEISHSIDPCNISLSTSNSRIDYKGTYQFEMDNEFPIQNLISCLRSENSIQAMPNRAKDQPLNLPKYDYCNFNANETPGYQEDQIGESFSDWMAVNTLVEFMKDYESSGATINWKNGILNTFKPICKNQTTYFLKNHYESAHPSTLNRINKLLLPHPFIQDKLGCKPGVTKSIYCDPTKPNNPYINNQQGGPYNMGGATGWPQPNNPSTPGSQGGGYYPTPGPAPQPYVPAPAPENKSPKSGVSQ